MKFLSTSCYFNEARIYCIPAVLGADRHDCYQHCDDR